MKIKPFYDSLTPAGRDDLAGRCETSAGHLRNVAYGKTCGEKLAVHLERATDGLVTRRDLRPDDWWQIWPELVDADHPVPDQREAA